MKNVSRPAWYGFLGSLSGVAAVTICYKFLIKGVNATTVALSFLLVVLFTAATHGIWPAILVSVVGMLCINFFFLPPVGTLTIADPQNWVALFAFLATAIIASQLSSTARKRAREAEKSREEVWNLYQLSRAIIVTPDPETAVSTLSRQVRDFFDVTYCQIYTPDRSVKLESQAAMSEPDQSLVSDNLLREVFESGETRVDEAHVSIYTPLKVGLKVTGVMVLTSSTLEVGTIEAISGLVALAMERARFLREISRTEALRQSDQLKSAILASVSHDLQTPLTSIRAAVDNLLERNLEWDREVLDEFHLIIREEVKRLTRLVQNLLGMARIEAGQLHPAMEWGTIQELFENVVDRCAPDLSKHQIRINLGEGLPMVKMDFRLIAEVLSNLIENAAKYSPDGSEIVLFGNVEGDVLTITVRDSGPGILPDELNHVFDKFFRGTSRSSRRVDGTGMGLAIARGIIEAHGGRIWVESTLDRGTTFAFTLNVETKKVSQPLASYEDEA